MNEMILVGPADKRMSSLEIAELVESRHDKVKQSIERLANRGVIELPPLGEISTATKPTSVYLLDKRSSLIVVAQLSPEFTSRIVDRWQELEAQAANPLAILNDPAAMRGLLLTYTERVIALESTVADQAPKVAALERITNSDGYECVTSAAKILQVRPKDLFNWMSANSWIYRRAGGKSWLAYQNRIQQGVLSHKITTVQRSDGSEKTVEQLLVTPKGLTRLSQEFSISN